MKCLTVKVVSQRKPPHCDDSLLHVVIHKKKLKLKPVSHWAVIAEVKHVHEGVPKMS